MTELVVRVSYRNLATCQDGEVNHLVCMMSDGYGSDTHRAMSEIGITENTSGCFGGR
jgi:hypothetical protein